jgi:hypothetical protein
VAGGVADAELALAARLSGTPGDEIREGVLQGAASA